MSTTQTTPDGLWLVTTTITPVPQPPVIPPTALSSGILDNAANWKQEQDAGVNGTTSKVTSMSNTYQTLDKARLFQFAGTGKPGVRWSNSFAKDATHFHLCYRGQVRSTNWGLAQQLELDMNQSMPNGFNVFLCTQLDSLSGTVQYTTTPNGACKWNSSNVKHNLRSWPANTWIPFAIYFHQDGQGNVVYDGIILNGIYTPFDPTCKGLSWIKLNWPSGTLINNFQVNAFSNPSGAISVEAQNLEVVRW